MSMNLTALILSSDDRLVRLLRRAFSDLEIVAEHCPDHESAIHQLTRRRFEAVIVDASTPHADQVLRSVRKAPANKRAIGVAILQRQTGMQTAFEHGAHFVLYQPLSAERAKASLRAVRALMVRERRRNARVPLEMPVAVAFGSFREGSSISNTTCSDFGEGGMALRWRGSEQSQTSVELRFTLPGVPHATCICGEIAWRSPNGLVGVRFLDLAPEVTDEIRAWLKKTSPELIEDDAPLACRLTDLSLGGCYLQTPTPFPAATRVALRRHVGELQLRAGGKVRVSHPEHGMGIEFTVGAESQRHVEQLIAALSQGASAQPELLVEPEGIDLEPAQAAGIESGHFENDPLLQLFHRAHALTPENFFRELERQRHSESEDDAEPILSA